MFVFQRLALLKVGIFTIVGLEKPKMERLWWKMNKTSISGLEVLQLSFSSKFADNLSVYELADGSFIVSKLGQNRFGVFTKLRRGSLDESGRR